MRTIIIEDESKAISALKEELQYNCPEIELVDVAQNIKDAIVKIQQHKPDLVFLDIQLQDGLGFEIFRDLETIDFNVIFTTAYSEYAVSAIKIGALDYLLKPIDSEELRLAVNKAIKQNQTEMTTKVKSLLANETKNTSEKRITLQTSEGILLHKISSIIRCHSEGNYTQIHFDDGKKLLIAKTLKEFDEMLSVYDFERIHHSHLINMRHMNSYVNKDGGYVVMSDRSTLPISQRKKSTFIKALNAFSI